MPTYIALLRGINVSGRRLVKMSDLQRDFILIGATNVRTYIQSGNVVFEHRMARPAALVKLIGKHLESKRGFPVSVIVKSAREFAAIARGNPYDTRLPEFGNRMYVCFFEAAPDAASVKSAEPLTTREERLKIKGDVGYAYYAKGLGRAKLGSGVIERKLGRATLRNWNTVSALLEMAQARK